MLIRPRRNRRTESIRKMVRETELRASDFILPLFVIDGEGEPVPVASMPGVSRWPLKGAVEQAALAYEMGLSGVAIFPAISDSLKDPRASESVNPEGLNQRVIREIKRQVPGVSVFGDIALDPYSSDGHDGLVKDGRILNDETLPLLAEMAVAQARAGVDWVAPSDMMDGRVGVIRRALDEAGFSDVGILAYSAKYASAFYGPFRDALDSAPRSGDKKTYQMDPANMREALREVELDVAEGADMVMVKPAGLYLDVISRVKDSVQVPVAAYHVSGEYAMIQAAAERGWLKLEGAMMESLLGIKRAGADVILSYYALEAARILRR